jgi:RNA polymerase sigma-70 factor (ECF subfamily)
MSTSDVELLQQWRNGDMVAGEILFERYYDPIARFFRSKMTTDISDLVQETFVACVEGRDRLQEDASFRAYIFSVAHNVLCAHLRVKYRDDAMVDFDGTSVEDLAPGPISQIVNRHEQRLLLEALRRIPVNYQILLELRYWEQLKTADIAQAMGVPHGTVRSRLATARKLLDEAMTAMADSTALLESTMNNFEEWARQCRDLDLVDSSVSSG